ncbi:MAG: carbonic anhydrase [Ilumatobacter fluminis]|uniref:carbonic anhydrase n=1 Tax=Ilumatobacter fluminis TaxID=467091 RepID=UPI0032EC8B85
MPDAGTTGDLTWRSMVASHAEASRTGDHDGTFPAHEPSAAVLACSDARVPPSLLFGQPSGNLFVVRIAGNSATSDVVASLTYAVEVLGVELVIVLGHSGCGAVTAAMSPTIAPELRAVLEPIDEMLDGCDACTDLDQAVAANVRRNLRRLRRDRGPLGTAITEHRVALRGAVHDLRSGELTEIVDDLDLTPIT